MSISIFYVVYSFAKGMTCIQMHHCLFYFLLVMISDATMLAKIIGKLLPKMMALYPLHTLALWR
jgi:hypothetical protein